ncbi:MAG: hypothetical protein ACE5JU_00805 [Candidatus Binatia bacterium]
MSVPYRNLTDLLKQAEELGESKTNYGVDWHGDRHQWRSAPLMARAQDFAWVAETGRELKKKMLQKYRVVFSQISGINLLYG